MNAVINLGAFESARDSLPVRFSDLSATENQAGQVELFWSSYTETHNKGFQLEHSKDGTTFTGLGFVPSQAAGDVSSSLIDDKYNARIQHGTVYYRFVQTGLNGAAEVFNTIRVKAGGP